MKKVYVFLVVLICLTTDAYSQVKVGDNPTVINSNSVLELESTNKGLLLPRVALTSTTNTAPLSNSLTAGMTVYNTASANDVTPGIYYYDGTKWVKIQSSLLISNALTQTGGLVNTVNGQTATTAISSGTAAQVLGFDTNGNPVYQTPASVLAGATTNVLAGTNNAITSTVNGVPATITPATGTIANTLGFDANGNLVNQTPASVLAGATSVSNTSTGNNLTTTVDGVTGTAVPMVNAVTNTLTGTSLNTTVNGVAATAVDLTPAVNAATTNANALTQAGGLVNTVNGQTATTAISSGTAAQVLGFDTNGNPVYQTPASVLAGATSVSNTSTGNNLTTTVDGVIGTAVPMVNAVTNTLTGTSLNTTVNGVAATAVDLTPAVDAATTNTNALTQTGGLVTTVNGQTATTAISSGTASQVLGFDTNGNPVYQSPTNVLAGATTNANALTQASGLVTTVNGQTATTAISSGTAAQVLGFDANGNPVYQTPASVLAGATSVSNTSTGNNLTTTVDGVTGTAVPMVNAVTNTLTGTSLTTTVNGVTATAVDLTPAVNAATTNANALTQAGGLVTTVNGQTATTTISSGTASQVLGFDTNGNPVYQSPTNVLAGATTNTNALTQAGGLVTTVNGQTATTAISSGTAAQVLGFDTNGNPVYQTPASVLAGATSVSNTSTGNNLTTTVDGVTGTAVPMVNAVTNTLTGTSLNTAVNGVAATAVDLTPAVNAATTNTNALTQAGGLVNTVNGQTATTAISSGTAAQVLGFDASGNPVYQTPASVLAGATTNALTGTSNTITSTVNGVPATITPATGTIANTLGFDASGNLVNQAATYIEPWYSVATQTGAKKNTDNIYINGKVGIGINTNTAIGLQSAYSSAILGVSNTFDEGGYIFGDNNSALNGGGGNSISLIGNGNSINTGGGGSNNLSLIGYGNTANTSGAGSNNIGIFGYNNSVTSRSVVVGENITLNGLDAVVLGYNGPSITISPSSNVGIGTTAPTNTLEVSATTNPLKLDGLQTGASTDQLLTADATGVVHQQTINSVIAAATTNNNALTQTGGLVTTVNGQTATTAISSGTAAQVLGFDANGNPVYQTPASVLAGATTNTLAGTSNAITSTVNGVPATITPATGTIANTLGFDANGNLVNQTPASVLAGATSVSNTSTGNNLTTTVDGVTGTAVPMVNAVTNTLTGTSLNTTVNGVAATAVDLTPAVNAATTNTNALTQAGGLVNTVNGQTATTAISSGTAAQVLGFDANGNPVYQTPASVLAGATTNTLAGTSNAITSTVNGVPATITPTTGTIANTLGFDANGNLVNQAATPNYWTYSFSTNAIYNNTGSLVGVGIVPDNTYTSDYSLRVGNSILLGNWNDMNQSFSLTEAPSTYGSYSGQKAFTLIGGNSFLDRDEVVIGGNTPGQRGGNEAGVQNVIFYTTPTKNTISGTERMRINANGYVGIGTNNPANALEVSATNNPLKLDGLQTGASTDQLLTADATGVVHQQTINSVITAATTHTLDLSGSVLTSTVNTVAPTVNLSSLPIAGDVTGTLAATTVAKINGSPLGTTTTAISGQVLTFNGTSWVPYTPTAIYKGRVQCTGATIQAITDANVTSSSTIIVSYEDPANGSVISVAIGTRTAGTSFNVLFGAIPPTTAYVNYTIMP